MPKPVYMTPSKPEPDTEYYTIPEVAYLLRCSVNTVRRRIAAGAPHSQTAKWGTIRVSRDDLKLWYTEHRNTPAGTRRPRRQRAAA